MMAPKTPAERMREYRKRKAVIDPTLIILPTVENHKNLHEDLHENNLTVSTAGIVGYCPSYHIELPALDTAPGECFPRAYPVQELEVKPGSELQSVDGWKDNAVKPESLVQSVLGWNDEAAILPNEQPDNSLQRPSGTTRGGRHIYLWKDVYIFTLLDVISDHQELLLDKTAKKKKVWGSIAASLNNICGTYFTSEQASVKYRTLLIRYKKYINFVRHQGTKGMQRPKFYNEMDRLKLVSQSLTMPSTVEAERAEENGSHSEPTINSDAGVTPYKSPAGSDEPGPTATRVSPLGNKPTRPQLSSADTSTERTASNVSIVIAASRIEADQENEFDCEPTMNSDRGVTHFKSPAGSDKPGPTATRVSPLGNKPTRPQLSSADTSTERTASSVSSVIAASRIEADQEQPLGDENSFKDFMELLEDEKWGEVDNRGKRCHHTNFKSLVHTFMTRQIQEMDEQRRFRERQQQTLESINKSILALVGQLRNQGQQRNRILDALVQNRRGNSQ